MIRQLLPPAPPFTALDAALRQGDFVTARRLHDAWRDDQADPDGADAGKALRALVCDYLANRYDAIPDRIQALAAAAQQSAETRAAAYFLLALTAIDQNQEEAAHTALEIAARHFGDSPQAQTCSVLAQAQMAIYLGRYDEAEGWLARAAARLHPGEVWAAAQHLRLTGLLHHQRTAYSAALAALSDARARFLALADAYEVARCDKALANAHRRLDQPAEAAAAIRRAIAYFQAQELAIPLGRCLNTLGAIQYYFNQHEEALASYTAALDILGQTGLRLEAVYTLSNMARTHHSLGQLRPALRYFALGQEWAAQLHMPDMAATLAHLQSRLEWELGRPEAAMTQMIQAGEIFAGAGAQALAALAYRAQAEYLIEQGQLDAAQALLEQSRATFLAHNRPAPAAENNLHLARIHLLRGDVHLARPLLVEAAAVLRNHQQAHRAAVADLWLGRAYLAGEELAEAESCLRRALAGAPLPRIQEGWRAHEGLAAIAGRQGQAAAGLEHLTAAVTEVNRLRLGALSPAASARLAAQSAGLYEAAIAEALALGHVDRALGMAEMQKSLQLVQHLRPDPAATDAPGPAPTALTARVARLEALHAAIAAAASAEQWAQAETLEQQFQGLVDELAVLNAPHAALYAPPALNLAQTGALLDHRHGRGGWACLSYSWVGAAPRVLHRFYWDGDTLQAWPAPLTAQTRRLIELACRPELSYRRHFFSPAAAATRARVQEALLPETIARRLQPGQTLYILPSGPLASFPFAALALAESFLGWQLHLSQAPSLPLLQALTARSGDGPARQLAATRALICALAGFEGPEALPQLPAVAAEAERLARLVGPDSLVLRDAAATPAQLAALQDAGRLETFDLLHLATHARFNAAQAALSAIILHGGELLLPDILAWRLSADLVTLAACDTALGHVQAGDEQMGLAHAFLIAGAKALLASLWPVADAATAHFFDVFYTALAAENASPAQALTVARRALAAEAPSPLAWGAFTLIGLA